ncbi:outer membrane beta-barrel protein [Aquimarina sp. AU474]|uniref:outer membrane beta-barrel protein n=1 Tax=Aquimarina sp. AU474 TaxID=2108529 RepID=UPI000D696B6F|nr:outer membrane beta-barrel protein [Aquimarina sp. AU474]
MIKKILVVVLAFVAMMSNAQEGTSSPYSFYGIGIQKFKGTVENRSMGGLSIISDSIHLNLQNPASFGELKLTTYTVGASNSVFKISDQTQSSSGDVASLDYLAVGIPAGKFGFGFGVIPITSVGYQLNDLRDDGSESRFTGTGGLNKVFLSAGAKVNKNLSVGLDFNYNFGNIENKAVLRRPDIQFDTREITSSNLSSFSLSLGIVYKRMITDKLELSASVVSTPSFGLTAESTRELATIVIGTNGAEGVVERQETELEDRDIDLPAEVKFGSGIGKPKNWFVGAEYTYMDSGDDTNALFIQDNVESKSASKFRMGGYYIPNYNSLTSYFSRVVYRAGFRYEETGLNINGTSIDEFGISFGVGLPVGRLFSNANLGFEFGQRGTTDIGLVKEEFFNFSISLSLNDQWFRKIKFN